MSRFKSIKSVGIFLLLWAGVPRAGLADNPVVQTIYTVDPASALPGNSADRGNPTFTNPVLFGDYPDPDIIRVGNDFYLATTTFVSVPGIEILHSKDLIHWEITGYAATTLDADPKYSMIGGSEYANGVWAPSLRYHNGTFYVIDNIQNAGTVVFRASNPAGPWTANRLNGYLYDPGLMFDDDGTPLVYNGTGGHISVAVLDTDLRKVVSSSPAFTLKDGEDHTPTRSTASFTSSIRVFGQYPVLLCSRSDSRTGPFTTTTVCDNHVAWSSPHQGGIVSLPNGDWWGFSLNDSGSVGRTMWVGPVTWSNDWPYFGNPSAPSIPTTNPMPNVGTASPILHRLTSDDFSEPKLGLQWQWNHNPDNAMWSLSARPGYLRLQTQTAPNFTNARNTLTLRAEGPTCTGIVKIDTSHLRSGDRAGLSLLEQNFGYVAVYKEDDVQRIVQVVNKNGNLKSPSEDVTESVPGITATALYLQVKCDFHTNTAQFSYSSDGTNFHPLGGDFPMHFTLATFQGERFGIFCYNPAGSDGWLDVDSFHLDVGAVVPPSSR